MGLSYDPLESGLFTVGLDEVEAAYSMPFPGAGPGALLQRLDEISERQPIGMIIPCLDAEIPNYLAVEKEITGRKIKVTLPSRQAFERRNKDRLNQLGIEAGVLVPRTIGAPDLASAFYAASIIGYPLFVKGRLYEARKVNSPSELPEAFHQMTSVWGGPALVQEVVAGDEYDVIGLGDGEGGIAGSCAIRKLLLTKSGKAFSGIVVSDASLQAQVQRIISFLKWNGPFELEFINGRNGYALIEANPRFPAWCDFPSQIGCNLPAAMLAGGDEPQTYSSLFYGETNFANKDQDYYATIISAMNGDIGRDGILFRLEGNLNNFDYSELLNAAQAKIDGTEWRGAASAGFQIVRDDIYYNVYGGLDYQSINLSPNDPSNAVRGERAGAKITAIIMSGASKSYYIDFASNYSTAFDTYFVRLRAGLKTGPGSALSQFAMGPEGAVFGDSGFDAQRLGLFLMLPIPLKPLDTVNVIAAGGYQWVTYNGDQSAAGGLGGGNGGYATLSFSLSF